MVGIYLFILFDAVVKNVPHIVRRTNSIIEGGNRSFSLTNEFSDVLSNLPGI